MEFFIIHKIQKKFYRSTLNYEARSSDNVRKRQEKTMRKILSHMLSFWYPKYLAEYRELEPYCRFIIGLSYIGFFVELIYSFINLTQGIPFFPTNLPLIGCISILAVVKYSKSYNFAADFFLAIFSATLLGLVFLFQSFPYTIYLWFPVFSVISVYLMGKGRGMIWTSILFIANIFLMGFFSEQEFGIQITLDQIKPIMIASIGMTMGCALYGSILFMNYISRLNVQLDQKNKLLIVKKNSLEESMREKKTLISIVCHDIATPLTLALNASSFALEKMKKGDNTKIEKYLKNIHSASRMATDIVEEVRKFEALESGKIEVELEPVNISEIFDTIKLLFEERLKKKNLELVLELKNKDELYIQAEEKSLTHSVFSNLISNAIKFSEPNTSIIVKAEAIKGKVQVQIKDFGIGMPENIVKNLFKQDQRTSRPGTQGEKGTGFGMPIAKVYMEKYGGSLDVVSKEKSESENKEEFSKDHGTEFTLTFNSSSGKKIA